MAAQNSGVALCRASNTFTPTCSFIFIQPTPTSAFCNLIVCKQGRLASIFMVLVQRIFSYKHMEHKELPCLFVLLNLFRISFILSGSVPVRRDFKGPTNWQADAFGARQLGRWSTDTITDNPHNKQTDTYTYTKVHIHTQTICECWVCLMLILILKLINKLLVGFQNIARIANAVQVTIWL